MFIPKDNENQSVVIHLDRNKTSNLQWVTKEESYKRMHKARRKAGKVVTGSKFSPEDVATLKGMLQKGVR